MWPRWIASGQPGSPAGPPQYHYSDRASQKHEHSTSRAGAVSAVEPQAGLKKKTYIKRAGHGPCLGRIVYLGIYKKTHFVL